jgi:hypothetical protein
LTKYSDLSEAEAEEMEMAVVTVKTVVVTVKMAWVAVEMAWVMVKTAAMMVMRILCQCHYTHMPMSSAKEPLTPSQSDTNGTTTLS